MPTISPTSARARRLRPGPPKDRDAGDSSLPAERSSRSDVQPGRGPDLREPRVQPGRGPDLRGDLNAEVAEPRTFNRLRPGPPKDREAEDTRRQFGPVAQPAAVRKVIRKRREADPVTPLVDPILVADR